MGLLSDDIDINLDKMTGIEFAKKLKKIVGPLEMSHFGCIKSNPEKSKTLETATFSIFGINVDINNLRSETYNNISRVPIIVLTNTLAFNLAKNI